MEEIAEFLSTQFPALLVVFSILVVVWLLMREYSRLRSEISNEVEKTVSAKLGGALSNVQEISHKIEDQDKKYKFTLAEIDRKYQDFSRDISEKQGAIQALFDRVSAKFGEFDKGIPDIRDESAEEIYYMATSAADGRARAMLCHRLLSHEDATSSLLERAGDLMRNSKRNSLALELYNKAVELDPERRSAIIELKSLESEMRHDGRNEALEVMIRKVLEGPTENGIARASNALIELDRYSDLRRFADSLLGAIGDDRKLKVMALRNKAVALRELGSIKESKMAFSDAFDVQPNDENTLKAYLSVLVGPEDASEFERIAEKLIETDPTVPNYYIIAISHYLDRGLRGKAARLCEMLRHLNLDPRDQYMLRQFEYKLALLDQLSQES